MPIFPLGELLKMLFTEDAEFKQNYVMQRFYAWHDFKLSPMVPLRPALDVE